MCIALNYLNYFILFLIEPVGNPAFAQSLALEWRYSFSQAEMLLADPNNLNEIVRAAFLAFKAVKKRFLCPSDLEPKLPSYHLKCILFKFMEEKETSYWNMPNNADTIFIELLCKLREAVEARNLTHFWISDISLLEDYTPEYLDKIKERIDMVMGHPEKYVADNWLECTRCMGYNCCYCDCSQYFKNIDPREWCPLCFVPAVYGKDMKGCFCPYEEAVFDVY